MESRCPECGMIRPEHATWCSAAGSSADSAGAESSSSPPVRAPRPAKRLTSGDKAILGAFAFIVFVMLGTLVWGGLGHEELHPLHVLLLVLCVLGGLVLVPVALFRAFRRAREPGPPQQDQELLCPNCGSANVFKRPWVVLLFPAGIAAVIAFVVVPILPQGASQGTAYAIAALVLILGGSTSAGQRCRDCGKFWR